MSGYVSVIGPCITCGRIFSFNPIKVPSTRLFTPEREPVCAACMARINAKRREMGLEPFVIDPEAYEAASEEEL